MATQFYAVLQCNDRSPGTHWPHTNVKMSPNVSKRSQNVVRACRSGYQLYFYHMLYFFAGHFSQMLW